MHNQPRDKKIKPRHVSVRRQIIAEQAQDIDIDELRDYGLDDRQILHAKNHGLMTKRG